MAQERYSNRDELIQEHIAERLEKQATLIEASRARSPRINVLVDESDPDNSSAWLIRSTQDHILHLADIEYVVAPFKNSPSVLRPKPKTVSSIESAESSWLLVYEHPENDELQRFTQIGKSLQGFIEEQFPIIKPPPVWIYRSIEEFNRQLPLVRIRYVGRLITANISSTARPV